MYKGQVYVKPPREGLTGVPDGSLIELLKGVFGLTEAPRLWWKKFERTLQQAGCRAVTCAKGVFVVHDTDGNLCGGVCVYVDDGLWAGVGPEFEAMRKRVRQQFNLKTEHEGTVTSLGRRVPQQLTSR